MWARSRSVHPDLIIKAGKEIFILKTFLKKKWLQFYATRFESVEINATFYGSFKPETYRNWADTTPNGFIYAIKGPRFISHILRLQAPNDSLEKFFKSAVSLGRKLGVVLWQFPPSFKNDRNNLVRLQDFLELLPNKISQVFEFRHRTWFHKDIYELLNKHKSGIVISESGRFPSEEIVVGGICYVRFHGPTSLYSSPYSTEQLKIWAEKVRGWSKKADVYCYFNNDSGGHAFRNAGELSMLLKL